MIYEVKRFLNSLVCPSFAITNYFLGLTFKFCNTFIRNTVKMSAVALLLSAFYCNTENTSLVLMKDVQLLNIYLALSILTYFNFFKKVTKQTLNSVL